MQIPPFIFSCGDDSVARSSLNQNRSNELSRFKVDGVEGGKGESIRMAKLNSKEKFDLLIFGSGSAAFAAAIKASEFGAKVAMTEHDTVGGTCANRGCIPSINLIAAAEMAHHARHSPFKGLQCMGFKMNFSELIRQKDELVKEFPN